ncbi:unnamed protein product [Effrenium voratum]|uniref:Uncharacterized protein n=1 Tax=Effrenium voratum TaxID=2562239 RepID=A0AA36I9B2_9DINO|nr:unnamed protein product [Effrenium voratum]
MLEKRGHRKTWARELVAGMCSGGPEALVTTPFQVVKIRMQNKDLVQHYANDFDCLIKVLLEEGPQALLAGLQSTVIRNCVWNGVYFGTISFLSSSTDQRDGLVGGVQRLGTGLCAGMFATCFNAPFDVAKSRIQQAKSESGSRTTFGVLADILRHEGPRALYKGFVPKAWRMGVGGAVGFVTFEFVHRTMLSRNQ